MGATSLGLQLRPASRRCPALPSPPLRSPARPSPRPARRVRRVRSSFPSVPAPAAHRGPQVGGAAALLPPPPPPRPRSPEPPRRKTKFPRVTDEGSAHAPNDPSRGTTLSSSFRDDSILDHIMKFGAECLTEECCAASPQAWSLRE